MSSRFAKQYSIPPEFPELLKDFTREVLRNQPANIHEFAAKYFDCLASGLPADSEAKAGAGGGGGGLDDMDMSLDEVESIIEDLFRKYDSDGNCYLDPHEFQALMEDLQQRLDFPPDEVLRFLAEADMNADGMIEYEEFIPLALQILQGMFAKKHLEQRMHDVQADADFLVHGMSREELTEAVSYIFEKCDVDGSGILSKAEFVEALQSMELGLTRREINTILFKIDQDQDGNISYREFTPFAFDLLMKLTSMHLLESELENDEMGQYLIDLFKGRDVEMRGTLHVEEIRDLLHQAQLGLSRMQIYTVISEAEVNTDNHIAYTRFIPRAVTLIRSMLLFENSIVKESAEVSPEEEDQYYLQMEAAMSGEAFLPFDEFIARTEQAGVISDSELKAAKNMLLSFGDEIPVEEAKNQVWILVKTLRRAKGS